MGWCSDSLIQQDMTGQIGIMCQRGCYCAGSATNEAIGVHKNWFCQNVAEEKITHLPFGKPGNRKSLIYRCFPSVSLWNMMAFPAVQARCCEGGHPWQSHAAGLTAFARKGCAKRIRSLLLFSPSLHACASVGWMRCQITRSRPRWQRGSMTWPWGDSYIRKDVRQFHS